MIHALLAAFIIGLILVSSEMLWSKAHLRGEYARKYVHILAGSFVAFLPFWLSYNYIALLGGVYVAACILNRYTKVFHAVHGVERLSWGDIYSGVAGIICCFAEPSPWVFTVAMLHLSLADGLAAVLGIGFSKKFYYILDHKKSVIGTVAFMIISVCILVLGRQVGHITQITLPLFFLIPPVTALLENVSGYGLDNITVPVLVLILLS